MRRSRRAPHVLELATRDVSAPAGRADCSSSGAEKLKLIPTDVFVGDAVDVPWEQLRLPVDIAFFFTARATGRPTTRRPTGPTESLLPVVRSTCSLDDDVQALLVNRVRGARRQWIVPIDDCYELVGLIRMHWRGFTGGAEMWARAGQVLDGLDASAGGRDDGKQKRAPTPRDGDQEEGQRKGNYESRAGTTRRHVDRRTVDRRGAESARADRPAHAEPVARLVDRPRASPSRAPRAWSTPRCRRCGSRWRDRRRRPVRSVLLDVQVQIAARRRGYDGAAHERLFELFGPAKDWGTTLRTLLWTRSTLVVPPFADATVVELTCRALRPRGHGVALPRRARRRRGAARVPLQRQRLLHGAAGAPDDAAVVGHEAAYALPVACGGT